MVNNMSCLPRPLFSLFRRRYRLNNTHALPASSLFRYPATFTSGSHFVSRSVSSNRSFSNVTAPTLSSLAADPSPRQNSHVLNSSSTPTAIATSSINSFQSL